MTVLVFCFNISSVLIYPCSSFTFPLSFTQFSVLVYYCPTLINLCICFFFLSPTIFSLIVHPILHFFFPQYILLMLLSFSSSQSFTASYRSTFPFPLFSISSLFLSDVSPFIVLSFQTLYYSFLRSFSLSHVFFLLTRRHSSLTVYLSFYFYFLFSLQ